MSFASKKALFLTKSAPKSGLFRFSSYCVLWGIKSFGLRQGFLNFTSHGVQDKLHVFCKQKSAFIDQKATKSGLSCFSSNGVTWCIKSFGLRQGFLIFSFYEDQNEFNVFCKQKSAFIDEMCAKMWLFSFQFILCHVRYQKLRLELRVPNFHLTLDSKEFHVFRKQKSVFIDQKATISGLFCSVKICLWCI
jgi:hypothetical protein